jgi:hypothetical protein
VSELLREFSDCFAWEYTEMLGLSRELVEHALPIKPGFRPYRQPPRNYNSELMGRIKEEIEQLLKHILLDHVGMPIGSPISCLLRRKVPRKLECVWTFGI